MCIILLLVQFNATFADNLSCLATDTGKHMMQPNGQAILCKYDPQIDKAAWLGFLFDYEDPAGEIILAYCMEYRCECGALLITENNPHFGSSVGHYIFAPNFYDAGYDQDSDDNFEHHIEWYYEQLYVTEYQSVNEIPQENSSSLDGIIFTNETW